MTLGDLISSIKTKAGSMFESSNDTTATQNLPALQARYQMYAADEMAAGRKPMPFQSWVMLQQQAAQ